MRKKISCGLSLGGLWATLVWAGEKELAQGLFPKGEKVSLFSVDDTQKGLREWGVQRAEWFELVQKKKIVQQLNLVSQGRHDPDYLAFREKTDRDWFFHRWLEQQLGQPSDQELQAYWKRFSGCYGLHQIRLQQIFFADEGTAQMVLKKIQNGLDFQAAAAQESLDPDRVIRRGEVGWVSRKDVDPLLFQKAMILSEKDVQDKTVQGPFALPGGVVLFRVLGQQKGRVWTWVEAEPEVRADWKEERKRSLLEKVLGRGVLVVLDGKK